MKKKSDLYIFIFVFYFLFSNLLGNKSNVKQRKLLVLSLTVPIVIQVVKKSGQVSDADFRPVAGTKRSVRDRLGSNVDSSVLHANKLDNKRCVLLSFFSFCCVDPHFC